VSQLYPLAFLSPRPPAPHAPCRRVPHTRSSRPTKTRHVAPRCKIKHVEMVHHLIFPSFSTPPLQGFNMFNVAFNKAIVVSLRVKV